MKKTWIMIFVIALMILSGCQAQAPQAAAPAVEASVQEAPVTAPAEEKPAGVVYPLQFVDGMGREVTIESEPQRVISLAPSITETIFALEANDKLVGRTDYCTYPEATAAIESIGTLKEPNIEAIVALEPDLIILSSIYGDETLKKLEELHLKVAVITAQEDFDGLYKVIGDLGTVLNVQEAATVQIEDIKARIAAIEEKVKGVQRPSVYYAVAFGESGEYTAGGDTFISQMIEMAGGDNVAKDVKGWSYSLEQLVEKDPQIVIVSNKWDSKSLFTTSESYKNLSAVQKGQVKEVDEDLVQIQGPRLVDGLEALVAAIHPELQ